MDSKIILQQLHGQTKELLDRALEESKDRKGWLCPLCGNGPKGDGLHLVPGKEGALKCFGGSCGFSGDIVDLWRKRFGLDFTSALKELAATIGEELDPWKPDSRSSAPKPAQATAATPRPAQATTAASTATPAQVTATPQPAPKEKATRQSGTLRRLANIPYYKACAEALMGDTPEAQKAREYITSRGIELATAAAYCIGFDAAADPAFAPFGKGDYKPHATPRLIVPVSEGFYVNRRAERTGDGKTIYPKGGHAAIWNTDAMDSTAPLVIVEGFFDALSFIESGAEVQVVALNSAHYAKILLDLVETANNRKFIVCPDQDGAGRKSTRELVDGIRALGRECSILRLPPKYKDANDLWATDQELFTSWVTSAIEGPKLDTLADYASSGAWERENKAAGDRLSTGFLNLDKALGGGLLNGLAVLAGASSLGKTTLALNVAANAAEEGHKVIFFSMEIARRKLLAKILARECYGKGYPLTAEDLCLKRYGDHGAEEVEGVVSSWLCEHGGNFMLREGIFGTTSEDITGAVESFCDRTGERPLVVVDYLQIIQSGEEKYTDYRRQVDKATHELKILAERERVPVLALSNIGRAFYYGELSFNALKESGGVEFAADIVLGMQFTELMGMENAKGTYDQEAAKEERDITLKVLKNRDGRIGQTARFTYTPRHDNFAPHFSRD